MSNRSDEETALRWLWFLLVVAILCWGEPDLLDVLARWCKTWMAAHP